MKKQLLRHGLELVKSVLIRGDYNEVHHLQFGYELLFLKNIYGNSIRKFYGRNWGC